MADKDSPPKKKSKKKRVDAQEEDGKLSRIEKSLSQISISTSNSTHGEKDFEEPSDNEPSRNIDDAESNNSSDSDNDNDVDDVKNNLEIKISKMPLLDGEFFTVDVECSSLDGPLFAHCNSCPNRPALSATFRTTSNFTSHLKRKHKEAHERYLEYAKLKRQGQGKLTISRKRWSCVFDQDNFEGNIANFFLKYMLPFRAVDDPVFRKIFDDFKFKNANLQMKHLTRYSLGKRVAENLSKVITEIREQLTLVIDAGGLVCTTADVWTGGARRFLGVTASWIDSETFVRKSAALACRRFPGTHSFDAIAELLSSIHASFGLTPESIRATVTDNASNFEKAFRILGIEEPVNLPSNEAQDDNQNVDDTSDLNEFEEDFSPEDIITVEEEFSDVCQKILPRHCKCVSHTLNLIVSVDIAKTLIKNEHLKRKHFGVLKKCSSLWKMTRYPKKKELLRTELGVAIQRPVVTRWNSSYDSFKQLINVKTRLIDKNIEGLTKPFTAVDFNYLEEYTRCSAPVANAIDLLQGDTCYYGILLPTLVSIKHQLKDLAKSDEVIVCKPVIEAIINGIDTRFEKLLDFTQHNVDAAIAAISYPRFKGRWLVPFDECNQRLIHEKFVEAVSTEGLLAAVSPVEENRDDDFEFGDSTVTIDEFAPSLSQGEIKAEVTRYLKSKETNLAMLEKFPNIRKTFLKYNTPLPSSAPVERLFSHATMLNLPKFNRLTEDHFEQRILAKANSQKKYI